MEKQYLVLSDIEGFEFQIFQPNILRLLSSAILVIECHDFTLNQNKFFKLVQDISTTHKVKILTGTQRIFPDDEILSNPKLEFISLMSDDLRWRIISEARLRIMKWIICYPKFFM